MSDQMNRRFDAIAQDQRADFRWILGIMLTGMGGLLAAMAGLLTAMIRGFHWY
jgi:hypothetical protein